MTKSWSNRKGAVVIAAASSLGTWAWAHGPQIQIGIESDDIVTRSLFLDEPYNGSVTPKRRAYEIPMALRSLGDANDGWYAQPTADTPFTGPGVATELGGFALGTVLSLTFTDGLKIWNGSGFVDPGTEQIDAYRGATHVAGAVSSDSGPFQSFSFTPLAGGDDEHKTAFFRLLGDGSVPNSPSDDGIYLVSLRLMSDQPGVNPSLPYYFLLDKNGSSEDAAAALAYVQSVLIPATAPAVSLGGMTAIAGAMLAAGSYMIRIRRRETRGS